MKKRFVDNFRGVETEPVRRLLFDKPFIKFVSLILVQFFVLHYGVVFESRELVRLILSCVNVLIGVYFVLVIVYIIRRTARKLRAPQSLSSLIVEYSIFVVGILLIFSTLFSLVEFGGVGYLSYGDVPVDFDGSIDSGSRSTDYFYFSAVTFFSVGYGDISPVGWAKGLAILTAFAGHLIGVVVIAVVINNYLKMKKTR